MRTPDRGLAVWGLATFHTVAAVLALLVSLYVGGALEPLLQGLSTLVGFVLFGALWGTNWVCTGRAVGPVLGAAERGHPAHTLLGISLREGIVWGGVNGLLFLLSLFAVSLFTLARSFPATSRDAEGAVRAVTAGLALFLGVGGVVSFVVGAAVGLVFGLVDWVLLLLAGKVAQSRA